MRDRSLGSTVRIYFSTHDSTGACVAPSSAFAASDFRIYKDGSATEKTTTNGITVTSPFGSLTGGHLIEIDTSNSTGDSGFWASGSAYRVVLSTAKTVDSKTVSGIMVGEFSIELQTADVRKNAGTAITASAGRQEVNVSHFGGTAGTFNSGRPEVNATHWAGTAVGSVTINCNMTQISGDTTAADNAESFFDGTGYAGTNNVIPTVTTLTNKTGFSLLATTGLGNQTANITGNLSGSVGSVTSGVTISGTTTTLDALQTALNTAHGSGSWATATGFSTHSASDVWAVGTRTITGGSLTTAPPTAAAIADAVWDEARTGHTTSGTFGFYLDAAISGISGGGGGGGSGDASQTTILEVQATVEDIAATLSGTPIEATSRVASGGTITAYIGDDFRVRSDTELSISTSDVGGVLYAKWAAIGEENLYFGASREGSDAGAIAGTVAAITSVGSGASQTVKLTVEITNCGSGLKPGTYEYQIEQRQAQGSETDSFIEIAGSLILKRNSVA